MKRWLFWLFLGISSLVMAQSQSVTVERYVDWEERQLIFYLNTAVEQGSLPVSKQRSEGLITRLKTSVIAQNLNDFPLDSWGSFQLNLPRNVHFSWSLENASSQASKDFSVFTADMRSVRVAYRLPFSAITSSITVFNRSSLTPSLMPSSQPFNYSGIVIFAAVSLPSRDNATVLNFLQPTLLPSVVSEEGQPLLAYNTVTRGALAQWGTAAYSFSDNPSLWPVERVGKNPLVIAARSLSGTGFIDAVVSKHDADRILASEQGRQLLEEGRVLIIIKNPDTNEVLLERMAKESDRLVGETLRNKFS